MWNIQTKKCASRPNGQRRPDINSRSSPLDWPNRQHCNNTKRVQ